MVFWITEIKSFIPPAISGQPTLLPETPPPDSKGFSIGTKQSSTGVCNLKGGGCIVMFESFDVWGVKTRRKEVQWKDWTHRLNIKLRCSLSGTAGGSILFSLICKVSKNKRMDQPSALPPQSGYKTKAGLQAHSDGQDFHCVAANGVWQVLQSGQFRSILGEFILTTSVSFPLS